MIALDGDDGPSPVLVGVDAGATKTVAIAVTMHGDRVSRVEGPGANPKRHGLESAADRIAALAGEVAGRHPIAILFVAGAGIDRPEHARALEGTCSGGFPGPAA